MTASQEIQPAKPRMNAKRKRRWYQFSLKTMIAAMTVLALALGIGLWCAAPAERQRVVVHRVLRLGGKVQYTDVPRHEFWPVHILRQFLPRDYFDAVVEVDLDSTDAKDSDLAELQSLSQLKRLWLRYTQVTDAGMVQLRTHTGLERLCLESTQISDEGLVHLTVLTQLKVLWLPDTKVTDVGLTYVSKLKHLERLNLADTQVTDQGLICLESLAQLEILNLVRTQVTRDGEARLRRALPHCDLP